MLYIIAVQQGQLYGTAYAIVGSQRGALGPQPLAVYIGLYGVLVEVKVYIYQLVADHVHVALQYHRLAVLVSGSSRLAYQHIASGIYLSIQPMLLAKGGQILNHELLVLRGTGDLIDFSKLLEHASGF